MWIHKNNKRAGVKANNLMTGSTKNVVKQPTISLSYNVHDSH